MLESGVELINLEAGVDYAPTFVSVDKRVPSYEKTTLGYWQIGATAQQGNSKGPVFKIEFVDLTSIATATHVKIWGVDNTGIDAPIYPLAYFDPTSTGFQPIIHVYLKMFEFCDNAGNTVAEDFSNYSVVGYKKRVLPLAW